MRLRTAIIVALLFLPILVAGQSADQKKYVNYEYKSLLPGKTLSNGVKHLGGGLIGDINADPVYAIADVEEGKKRMLWLEVSTGRNSNGVTGWKVLDVLSFPALKKGEYLFREGDPDISCTRKKREIPNLVGIGQISRRSWVVKPSKLWVANLGTKKFEPMSLANVKCEWFEP